MIKSYHKCPPTSIRKESQVRASTQAMKTTGVTYMIDSALYHLVLFSLKSIARHEVVIRVVPTYAKARSPGTMKNPNS